jgi:cytochrome c553
MEQIMKLISLRMTLQTLTIAIVLVSSAYAEDNRSVSNTDLQAKIDYCKTCHGLSGQGFRGAFPMPRLAGQQPEYVENQLKAFAERRRTNPVMFNVAHALSPAMLAALTRQFEALNPKPLGGAPQELMAASKTIYQDGRPGAEIPPVHRATGPMPKAPEPFPAWPVSFMITS